MPRQVFIWYPDVGSSLSIKPAVEVTKFGDGYELRTSFSINTMQDKWSVMFTRSAVEGKAILAFLKTHAGKTAFDWQNPHEVTAAFVCREWGASRLEGNVLRVTCTFEQVFEA